MKKIVLFILLLLVSITSVNAKTYYSDYKDYIDYQEEKIEETELVKVLEQTYYHVYKEEISYEYLEDSEYNPTGKTKIEYSDIVSDKNLLDQNYEIEEIITYEYKPFTKLNYLYLTNYSSGTIFIEKLIIYDLKKEEIISQVSDYNMYKGDVFIYDINKEYNFNDIAFFFLIDKVNEASLNIQVTMNNIGDFNSARTYITDLYDNSSERHVSLKIDDFKDNESLYDDVILETNNKDINGKIISQSSVYRNVYKYNEYEVINRVYEDLYLPASTSEYNIDLNDSKTYYKAQIRDKIVIDDNLLVTDKNIDLKSFISETTIDKDNIDITSNIDLNINGTYKINFILPFKTISNDITIDIKENYINALNKQEEYINYLYEKTEEAVYKVDNKNEEIKEIITSNVDEVNDLKEKLNNCNSKSNQTNDENKLNLEKTTNKQSFNILLLLLIFTLIFIVNKIVEKRLLKK